MTASKLEGELRLKDIRKLVKQTAVERCTHQWTQPTNASRSELPRPNVAFSLFLQAIRCTRITLMSAVVCRIASSSDPSSIVRVLSDLSNRMFQPQPTQNAKRTSLCMADGRDELCVPHPTDHRVALRPED